MWIQRTPEEIAKWHKDAEGEARAHGWLIGGIVWVVVAVFTASGWLVFLRGGIGLAVQRGGGDFWLRLPLFGILAAPFAYWIYRQERAKERAKLHRITICPKCDIASESNIGTACQCGGKFVSASNVKWVEGDPVVPNIPPTNKSASEQS